MSATRKNHQRAQKAAARKLADETGLPYQEALRRVRAQRAAYAVTVLAEGHIANTEKVTGLQAARDTARAEIIDATSGSTIGELRKFIEQADSLPVDGGTIGPLPDRAVIRVALAERLVQLDPGLRGVFAEGYTDDDIDRVLSEVSRALGLRLVCVWGYCDEWGCGGDSEIVCMTDQGAILPAPDGLLAFLDGQGDGLIDPRTTGTAPYEYIDPADLADPQIGMGHNLVYEDRRHDDDHEDDDDTGPAPQDALAAAQAIAAYFSDDAADQTPYDAVSALARAALTDPDAGERERELAGQITVWMSPDGPDTVADLDAFGELADLTLRRLADTDCERCDGTGIDPAAPGNRCELCGATGNAVLTANWIAELCDLIDALPEERMGDLWSRYTGVMIDLRDIGRPKHTDRVDWLTLHAELTATTAS